MSSPFRRVVVGLACLLAIVLAVAVFYFSWIPDPAMGDVRWLSRGLARWADHFDRLRTGVPFLPLGILGGWLLRRFDRRLREWFWLAGALVAVVTIAELGQLFLPRRTCDWRDIAWGAAGAVLGLLPTAISRWRKERRESVTPPGGGGRGIASF